MAQTPKSVSAYVGSTTPVTLYTVPVGATAVVKSVLTSSLVGTYPQMTINKVSGGITYPLVYNANSGYATQSGTYFNVQQNQTLNLLNGPVTLTAGDILSVSTSSTAYYKLPSTTSPTTNPYQRINNFTYINGKYIAVGYDNNLGRGLILTSTDGITYTNQNFIYNINITDIAYDGSTNYVVVGTNSSGYIYYSTNLSSWTQQALPSNYNMYCVTYGNGYWVTGGISGRFFYATAPTSWTANQLPNAAAINSILTIGSNWAFGTEGTYAYTSNFSTFTFPYYLDSGNIGQGQYQLDTAGKVFMANGNDPQSSRATSCSYSTNNAKTNTYFDFTSVSGTCPTSSVLPLIFGNGGRIYWMSYHPGNSRYMSSSDGVTYINQTFGGNYNNESTTWYNTNMYTNLTSTYNSFQSLLGTGYYASYLVDSSGTVTNGFAFSVSATYMDPLYFGVLIPVGNPFNGNWLSISYKKTDSNYTSQWYGSTPSNGSDGQRTDNRWYIPSYNGPTAGCAIPGADGFLVGTASGYVMKASTNASGFSPTGGGQFLGSSSPIAGIAAAGTSTTSRIVVLNNAGQPAYSTDGGVTWTLGNSIGVSFGTSGLTNNSQLQYGNGVWIALSNSGVFYYSTDGISWTGNPIGIKNMFTLNSNNVFIKTTGNLYTTGTSVDAFSAGSGTAAFGNFPSVRRGAFVGGTYLIGGQNSIFASTDLVNWTSNAFDGTQINNQLYYTSVASSAVAIGYSGTGTSIAVGNALRSVSSDNVSFGQPTVLANALVVGSTTAGIVEIT